MDINEHEILGCEEALHSFATRLTGDPNTSADLIQEAYVRLIQSTAETELNSIRPLLFTIVRNLARDRWRLLDRERELQLELQEHSIRESTQSLSILSSSVDDHELRRSIFGILTPALKPVYEAWVATDGDRPAMQRLLNMNPKMLRRELQRIRRCIADAIRTELLSIATQQCFATVFVLLDLGNKNGKDEGYEKRLKKAWQIAWGNAGVALDECKKISRDHADVLRRFFEILSFCFLKAQGMEWAIAAGIMEWAIAAGIGACFVVEKNVAAGLMDDGCILGTYLHKFRNLKLPADTPVERVGTTLSESGYRFVSLRFSELLRDVVEHGEISSLLRRRAERAEGRPTSQLTLPRNMYKVKPRCKSAATGEVR